MNEATNRSERRFLQISAGGNLVSACLGLTFAALTSSQAILLDGFFDLVYFSAALFTLKVSRLVHRVDDAHFPVGYAFFEPLTNLIKGLLVTGISLMALAGALQALFSGGRQIAANLAIAYGCLAVLLCVAMVAVMKHGGRKHESPLLRADSENWIVNGAISACVVLAFASILVLERIPSLHGLIPYVDPTIVIAVVSFSFWIPVRMAWNALMQLLNRAPSEAIVEEVNAAVRESIADLPVSESFVRVLQPGRARAVLVHVVLPHDHPPQSLQELDAVRARTLWRLKELHLATALDMLFSTDRRWGEPVALTQSNELTAHLVEASREQPPREEQGHDLPKRG